MKSPVLSEKRACLFNTEMRATLIPLFSTKKPRSNPLNKLKKKKNIMGALKRRELSE